MVGAAFTMFRMRKNLFLGLSRAFAELGGGVKGSLEEVGRTNRYMSSRAVLSGIGVVFIAMIVLYTYFSGSLKAGIVAGVVMLFVGFCFATVSGYLVGVIGSSNNPISGLTLSTLIIAALLLVALGVNGTSGVIAVLGVAAVVCVSSAVAGELLQDFKVGYILGGTPRTIQVVELIAVVCASVAMYFPLLLLHQGNINAGGVGFGDPKLSAPQAGLMASLAQGIVGGDMAWPLIGVGICLGITLILVQVKSPMLVAIGMYLPFGTTSAIFIGGMIRWWSDSVAEKAGLQRGPARACGKCGRAGGFRPDCGRSAHGTGDGWLQSLERQAAISLPGAFLLDRRGCDDRTGVPADAPAVGQCGASGRSTAAPCNGLDLRQRGFVKIHQLGPGTFGIGFVVDGLARLRRHVPAYTSRAGRQSRLPLPPARARRRTLLSTCLWPPAVSRRRLPPRPKYICALIFGASRCGLSGLSVTSPPTVERSTGADPVRHGRSGLHHQRATHAIPLRTHLLRLIHFLLRVQERHISPGVFFGVPGGTHRPHQGTQLGHVIRGFRS